MSKPCLDLSLSTVCGHSLMKDYIKKNDLYDVYKQRFGKQEFVRGSPALSRGKTHLTSGLKDVVTVEIDAPVFS